MVPVAIKPSANHTAAKNGGEGERERGTLFRHSTPRRKGGEEEKSPRLQMQEQPASLALLTPFFTQLGATIREGPSRNRAGGRELSARWNAGSEKEVVTGSGKRKKAGGRACGREGERGGRNFVTGYFRLNGCLSLPPSLSALSTRRRCRSHCSLPSSRENFW